MHHIPGWNTNCQLGVGIFLFAHAHLTFLSANFLEDVSGCVG